MYKDKTEKNTKEGTKDHTNIKTSQDKRDEPENMFFLLNYKVDHFVTPKLLKFENFQLAYNWLRDRPDVSAFKEEKKWQEMG